MQEVAGSIPAGSTSHDDRRPRVRLAVTEAAKKTKIKDLARISLFHRRIVGAVATADGREVHSVPAVPQVTRGDGRCSETPRSPPPRTPEL
jgi:hypothetical protein